MITSKTPVTEKMDIYRAKGLSDDEVRLLTTPISRLNKELGAKAMKALDKLHGINRKLNEENCKEDTRSFIEKVRGADGKGPNVHTYETT